MSIPPPLASAGGGARRRPKNLPSLPMSAFSPPNTGTSDMFPMPPTPSAVFPESIVDAHATPATLAELREEGAARLLADKVKGVVLVLDGDGKAKTSEEVEAALAQLQIDFPVLSVLVPFSLSAPPPAAGGVPASAKYPTTLYTTFNETAPQDAAAMAKTLRWALQTARVVDIDVQGDAMANDAADRFVALLTDATEGMQASPPTIVLSNVCPPPHDLSLPIVKLMNHPTYRAYQSQTATLSFFPKLHIKFTPPSWGAPLPPRGTPSDPGEEALEWKRRIKMYIGPVLEAFGYERIIFGTAPSPANASLNNASVFMDWYALVRESFAELAVEQEAIDAVFAENARRVYGTGAPSSS